VSSRIEALMRGLGQGASLGLGDEIAPWLTPTVDDGTGIPREYAAGSADADMRANERRENADAEAKYPTTYRSGQIAGGIPSSIAMSGMGAGAPNLAARIAAGGLAAGTRGGIEGAGLAADGNRLNAAARAAGPSAALGMAGAAAPTAVKAVKDLFKGGPPGPLAPAMATVGSGAQPSAREIARGAQAARTAGTTAGPVINRALGGSGPAPGKTVPPPRRGATRMVDKEAAGGRELGPEENVTHAKAIPPPRGDSGPINVPKSQALPKIEHLDFDKTATPLIDEVRPQGATTAPQKLMGSAPRTTIYPQPTAVAQFDAEMPIPPAGRTGMEQRLPALTDEAVENFTQQFGKRKPAYNYPQDYIQDYVRDELEGIAKRRGE